MIGARAAVAGLVVAIALGGSSTSWPQYRGDSGHSGWNQSEKTLSPTSVKGLRLAWKYPVNGAVESSVSVVGGIVYATSVKGSLVALRGSDGGRVWATQIAGGIGGGSPAPALSGGRLFITADSGDADVSLYAYDAAAGKLLWAADIGGMHGGTGGATTYGDTVFVHRYDLMAIDPATGEERWSQLPECFECNPAVASGLVLTMDDDSGGLQARAVSNGRLRWQVRGAGRFSSPVVAGNRVFSSSVGDGDSAVPEILWAFSLHKGKRLWKKRIGWGGWHESLPAIDKNRVFYASRGGYLYAFRIRDGRQIWSKQIVANDRRSLAGSPIVANDVVYIAAARRVLAYGAANGKRLWSAAIGSTMSTPTVLDGTLYVGNERGTIFAFRLPSR